MHTVAPTPLDHYTLTLPHVAHAPPHAELAELAELVVDPELAGVDPRQGVLPGLGGVLAAKHWVRGNARAWQWHRLDLQLAGIDKHRGRKWTRTDYRVMAAVERQTWNAADLGQRPHFGAVFMKGDAIVSPTSGRTVDRGRNPRVKQMLEILWSAYEAGTGGVFLSRAEWAARLECSSRSVYTYQRELVARGLARVFQTWAPAPGTKRSKGKQMGSRRGYLLMRIGPELEALAGIEPLARRSCAMSGVDPQQAQALAVALRKRARVRNYHLAGQHWRVHQEWSLAKDFASEGRSIPSGLRPTLNRQPLPRFPPQGTNVIRSPLGTGGDGASFGRKVFRETPVCATESTPNPSPTISGAVLQLAQESGLGSITEAAQLGVSAEFLALFQNPPPKTARDRSQAREFRTPTKAAPEPSR